MEMSFIVTIWFYERKHYLQNTFVLIIWRINSYIQCKGSVLREDMMCVPSRNNWQGIGIVMECVMKERRIREVTLSYSLHPSNNLPFTPLLVVMMVCMDDRMITLRINYLTMKVNQLGKEDLHLGLLAHWGTSEIYF